MTGYSSGEDFALAMDGSDPLRHFRDRFLIPRGTGRKEKIYLCGNSLGLQPRTVRDCVGLELKDWSDLAVEAHTQARNPWLSYHELLTGQTARLVGAKPIEVVVMNSLTVNLHLMMVSFYRPTAARYKILMEATPFPSDRYAVESQISFHGYDPRTALLELQPREGESFHRTDDILSVIEREGKTIALVLIGGVNYYSGQAFALDAITAAARTQGCVAGFDLAHATGNIPLKLHDWNVDFAVWCSYKYLNAGPGSTAGCFVHERHARRADLMRFAGWWGHNKETRFLMGPEFSPIPGAEGWQLSNPAILPLASLRASMNIFDEAGMEALRAKSERLTGYLEFLLKQEAGKGVDIITPSDPGHRGAQLSLRMRNGGRNVFEALIGDNIVCDWREPDIIRIAPVPLYNSFHDVYEFVRTLSRHL